jgi:hypothetical protein
VHVLYTCAFGSGIRRAPKKCTSGPGDNDAIQMEKGCRCASLLSFFDLNALPDGLRDADHCLAIGCAEVEHVDAVTA